MRISFYIACLIFIILVVLTYIHIDWVRENIAVVSGLATAFAFVATSWTAFEARASATAAMEAVNLTSHSLYEMRKSSFKQWFELLLEQHDTMHDEVQSILINNRSISIKLKNNFLSGVFLSLAKNKETIRYINHIISMLEFIDNDFYSPSARAIEKNQYVEQLTNKINPDVKLAIAILGLNVFDNGTYKPERLNELLNKYNFFAKECFFKEALDSINQLDRYVKEQFDAYYRKSISYYMEKNILNHHVEIINPINHSSYQPLTRTNFVVMWAYNNLCQSHFKRAFDNLPKYMMEAINHWLDLAPATKKKHEDIFRSYVGYDLNVPGCEPIKIKTRRHLKLYTDVYISNPRAYDLHSITLTCNTNRVYFIDFESKLDEYKLTNALLALNENPNKAAIISKILDVVSENIAFYKEQLNGYTFNN